MKFNGNEYYCLYAEGNLLILPRVAESKSVTKGEQRVALLLAQKEQEAEDKQQINPDFAEHDVEVRIRIPT